MRIQQTCRQLREWLLDRSPFHRWHVIELSLWMRGPDSRGFHLHCVDRRFAVARKPWGRWKNQYSPGLNSLVGSTISRVTAVTPPRVCRFKAGEDKYRVEGRI